MFDLRSLEHSTILYEAAPSPSSAAGGGGPAGTSTTTTSAGSGGGGSSGHSSAGTTTTTAAAGKETSTGGTSPLRKKTGGGGSSSASSSANNNNGGPPGPLLRLAFSPTSPNYLAVVHADSPHVQILDTRSPGTAAFEVRGHKAPVNGIAWGTGGATMSGASGGASGSGPGWLSTVCESFSLSLFFVRIGTVFCLSEKGGVLTSPPLTSWTQPTMPPS